MNLPDINNSLDKAARGILDFLMPRRCPFCGAVAGKKLLCEHCSETLPFTGEHAVEETAFARCAAPLYYEGAVRQAILRFKFGRKLGSLPCFGRLMAPCAAETFSGELDALTWVPVRK